MMQGLTATRRHFIRLAGVGAALGASEVAAQELARNVQVDVGPAFLDPEYREQVAIAQDAYIWGYPLVNMGEFQKIFRRFDQPVNRVVVNRDYVVDDSYAPNLEILYGFIYIDLTEGPHVLSVPDTAGRYYSFQFIDAYSNVIAYVSQRTTKTKATKCAIVGPGWRGKLPSGLKRIESPHQKILCIIRTFVGGKEDFAAANAIIDQYRFDPLSSYPDSLAGPASMNTRTMVQVQPMLRYESFGPPYFDLLGDQLAVFPPPDGEQNLLARFAKIGIGPGLHPSTNKDEKAVQALRDGIRLGEAKIVSTDFSTKTNGWSVIYGVGPVVKDPVLRAFINRWGTGYHIAEEALYFMRMTGADGKQLNGANKYRLRFAKDNFPPVNAFWTLSLMKPNSMPIQNPINRWSIASNTPGLHFDADGSLEIAIQNEQPGEGPANWLPSGNEAFRVTLRLYMPNDLAAKGGYKPPQLQHV